MARSGSPTRFNGYDDDTMYQNMNYAQDINEQMRVPKRIKATGEYFDEHELLSNNGAMNSWNYSEKFDMTVPDRIVVIGQDQHLGTRSAPREIILDNSVLPTEPGSVRVSTPPRVISLSEHHFPSASDEPRNTSQNLQSGDHTRNVIIKDDERQIVRAKRLAYTGNDLSLDQSRGDTPPIGNSLVEQLTPSEEVIHLRRQMAKINRRVLAIELETEQRQQRERIVYCIGLAYFLIKAIMWLNRN